LLKKESSEKLMRMRELTTAAGVNKGTILFYVKEGLIQKPIKKHANSAFYTEEHLNDIRLIKDLQAKRFLPLTVIKEVMKGGKGELSVDEIKTLAEIDGKLYQNLNETPSVKAITQKQLLKHTKLSLKELKELEEADLTRPILKGKRKYFEEDDIRMAECWAKAKKAGYTNKLGFHIDILKIHKHMIDLLVEEEARALTRRVSGKIPIDKIAQMVEEMVPIMNTFIGILHKRSIKETTERYRSELQEKTVKANDKQTD